MGASNSRDVIPTPTTEGGENVRIKYGAGSMQGFGAKMEDAYAVVPDLDHSTSFFGLYDGHGGPEVALLCARLFHIELRVRPNYQSDLNNAIRSVFSRMDEVLQLSDEWRELVKPTDDSRNWIQRLITTTCLVVNPWHPKWEPYIPPQSTGSSVCVAVTRGNQLIVGNVGDSRCVASRDGQATQLSTDHKPRHQYERQRIERAGGTLDLDNHVVIEVGRVPPFSLVQGTLATSRSIGDFVFKQNKKLPPEGQIVTCNPDILTMEITNDIEFLVIASLGIWASMTCQDVVDFVHKELGTGETDLSVICHRLVRHILPSPFDTTAILIQFKHVAPDSAEENEEDNQKIKSDASDEIKSDASDEIKSDDSDEIKPYSPNG